MQTREQKRSQFALEKTKEIEKNIKLDKETANFLVGLPTLVLTNGLGQSLAFLLSKQDDKRHQTGFDVIRSWLNKVFPKLFGDIKTRRDLLSKLTVLSSGEYVTAQSEVLQMLNWLKRYARAFEEKKSGEGGRNDNR
ncbi:MAG: type III-B CRISPR module-associated protein Cmr5 [Proteobacteria bacterium]|nr:type III-B CRISPR module-associated protein Cmr5 [Pseudomonadota bacterium]